MKLIKVKHVVINCVVLFIISLFHTCLIIRKKKNFFWANFLNFDLTTSDFMRIYYPNLTCYYVICAIIICNFLQVQEKHLYVCIMILTLAAAPAICAV
jgi:hypothetical protein